MTKKNIIWLIFIALLLNMAIRAHAATELETDTDTSTTTDTTNVAVFTVSDAVTYALVHNPAIHEADARIGAARASKRSALADMLPQGTATYGYVSMSEIPIRKQAGMEVQVAHQQQYNWDVTVVQPLFAGFALASGLNISDLALKARQLEKEQTVLDLTQGVKSTCYHLLLAQRLAEVSDREVEAYTAHRRDAELFHREGLIRPNDLLQAQVALANAIQQREKARADVRKAGIRLNLLLNRPLDSPVTLEENQPAAAADKPLPDIQRLDALALQERPLIKLLDVSLKQLDQSLRIAKSAWYPTVSLIGKYEQSGDDFSATENDYANDHNSSVMVQARWTFFRSGKTRAQTAEAKQQIKALEAGIIQYRSQVYEQIRIAMLDCRTARNNIHTAAQALTQAEENWRITNLQYKQQVATSTDVLDARTFLTQADTNYQQAVYGYLDALAGLDRAVGGKWQQEEKDFALSPPKTDAAAK